MVGEGNRDPLKKKRIKPTIKRILLIKEKVKESKSNCVDKITR